jgi:hypothetical protein
VPHTPPYRSAPPGPAPPLFQRTREPAPQVLLPHIRPQADELLQRRHAAVHGGVVQGGTAQVVARVQVVLQGRQPLYRRHVAAVGRRVERRELVVVARVHLGGGGRAANAR